MITANRFLHGTGRLMALAAVLVLAGFYAGTLFTSASQAQTVKKAPAKTQNGAAQINKAIRLLKAGKTTKATTLLNKTISAGGLANRDLARALHYRGVALRAQGKPAEAIADLTSALWLKNGLPPALRAQAQANRAAAFKEAGAAQATGRITRGPVATAKGAARAKSATRTAKQTGRAAQTKRRTARANRRTAQKRITPAGAPTKGWQAQTRQVNGSGSQIGAAPGAAAAQPPKAQNGFTKFFSNLFAPGSAKPKPAAKPRAAARRTAPKVSAWNSTTTVRGTRQRAKARARANRNAARLPGQTGRGAVKRRSSKTSKRTAKAATRKRPARRPVADPNSSYRLILSPVRSEAKARANARAMQQRYASLLANRRPVIETTSFGGSTFYQVRVGPFKGDRSPRNICAQLKAGGVDCILSKL